MSRRLARMVIRVDAGLHETLTTLAARLFNETRHDYSLASMVRGLIAIGLIAVADVPHLAPMFAGSRLQRGRKKGELRPRRRDLALISNDDPRS